MYVEVDLNKNPLKKPYLKGLLLLSELILCPIITFINELKQRILTLL